MSDSKIEAIRDRAATAKLSSDDHGHDCTALREYCERELIWAYEEAVPLLLEEIDHLRKSRDSLQSRRLALSESVSRLIARISELDNSLSQQEAKQAIVLGCMRGIRGELRGGHHDAGSAGDCWRCAILRAYVEPALRGEDAE